MARRSWPCSMETAALEVAAEIVAHAWERMALHGIAVRECFERAFDDVGTEMQIRDDHRRYIKQD